MEPYQVGKSVTLSEDFIGKLEKIVENEENWGSAIYLIHPGVTAWLQLLSTTDSRITWHKMVLCILCTSLMYKKIQQIHFSVPLFCFWIFCSFAHHDFFFNFQKRKVQQWSSFAYRHICQTKTNWQTFVYCLLSHFFSNYRQDWYKY